MENWDGLNNYSLKEADKPPSYACVECICRGATCEAVRTDPLRMTKWGSKVLYPDLVDLGRFKHGCHTCIC